MTSFPHGSHAGKPLSSIPVGHLIHFLEREELMSRHKECVAPIRDELARRRDDKTKRSPYVRRHEL